MKTRLAYDVGAFDGADTAHFLRLGYRVISIEASPALAENLNRRFAAEILAGECVVLNVAVGETDGVLPFFLSQNPLWSSFDRAMATRGGLLADEIAIPARRLGDVIADFGEPEFIKIDVEGADYACLRAMDCSPRYLSFEASELGGDEMLLSLVQRGYKSFSLVEQHSLRPITIPSPGTLAHTSWSLRQYLRWQLRSRPRLHSAMARARSSLRWSQARKQPVTTSEPSIAHGLTPMEHDDGWYSAADFLWLWRNVVAGGLIDSSWFDVHAKRS